jgi:hypothetical protein
MGSVAERRFKTGANIISKSGERKADAYGGEAVSGGLRLISCNGLHLGATIQSKDNFTGQIEC